MKLTLALVALLGLTGCEKSPPESKGAGSPSARTVSPSSHPSSKPPEFWRRLADRWVVGNAIPDFRLTNQEGDAFQLADLRGDHVLVGLIFTHCSVPEACPRTINRMFEVGKQWKAKEKAGTTQGTTLRLLTLTFDPDEDTPEVLKAYSEGVRSELPDWVFATGPTELMEKRLPSMFGVIAGNKNDDGAIAHSVKAVLLGPGLRPLKTWSDNAFEPEDVFAAVLR